MGLHQRIYKRRADLIVAVMITLFVSLPSADSLILHSPNCQTTFHASMLVLKMNDMSREENEYKWQWPCQSTCIAFAVLLSHWLKRIGPLDLLSEKKK